jgi:transposase
MESTSVLHTVDEAVDLGDIGLHILYGVLWVAQGMTCPEVSRLRGGAPRPVRYRVRRFEASGLAGQREGRRARRPRRLSEAPLRFHVRLQVRQCQRLLRQRDWRQEGAERCAQDFLLSYITVPN